MAKMTFLAAEGCLFKKTNIAAMCTGTFMLAETGLLNGKIATTNWQFGRRFRSPVNLVYK